MVNSSFKGDWTFEQLLEAEHRGDQLKFMTFWGHRPRREGQIGSHVLSQWFPHECVAPEGHRYPTAEHFMMAEKARLFGDDNLLDQIAHANSPGHAKDLGRRIRGFDESTWAENRFSIVHAGSIAKFGHCLRMRNYLVGTGFRVLVEASPVDPIWGIGAASDDASVHHPSQWKGQNLLGFALMSARAELLTSDVPDGDCPSCAAEVS